MFYNTCLCYFSIVTDSLQHPVIIKLNKQKAHFKHEALATSICLTGFLFQLGRGNPFSNKCYLNIQRIEYKKKVLILRDIVFGISTLWA